MKKKYIMLVIITSILLMCFFVYILDYINSNKNISEIKLCISTNVDNKLECVFKEKDNIIELLNIKKQLKNFKSDDGIMTPYSDIEINVVYMNGVNIKDTYKIRPYLDLFDKLLSSVEARRQSIPLLYEDTSSINSLTLKSPSPKNNSIEITDKIVIDEIILDLKEYYLSDKILEKNSSYLFNNIEVYLENFGYYTIFSNNEKIIKLLKEKEIYNELIITSADIKDMSLTRGTKTIEIRDKKTMDTVLENAYNGSAYESSIYVKATLNILDETKIYASFLNDRIPQEIERLFKE